MTLTKEQRERLERFASINANNNTVLLIDLRALLAAYDEAQRDAERLRKLVLRWMQFYNLCNKDRGTVADMNALRQESDDAMARRAVGE